MMMPSGVEVWDNSLVQSARLMLNRSEPGRQGWTFLKWAFIGKNPNIVFRHFDGRTCCVIANSIAEKISDIAMKC